MLLRSGCQTSDCVTMVNVALTHVVSPFTQMFKWALGIYFKFLDKYESLLYRY